MDHDDAMNDAPYWRETPELMKAQLVALLQEPGGMLSAMKLYREHHGVELGVAQRAVTHLKLTLFPPDPTPPCPECGAPLRTALAKQCVACGADWHATP